jgi:hypothetical protein
MVPVSPSTRSKAPCQAINPASVTTNDGMPKKVLKKPLINPIAVPASRPTRIASAGDQPCWTVSTAMIPAHRPLTAPIERSISPSSRTSTTPIEMIPMAVT